MLTIQRAFQELGEIRAMWTKMGTRIQWLENDLKRGGYLEPQADPIAEVARVLWDEHSEVGNTLEACLLAGYDAITARTPEGHPAPAWIVRGALWCKPARIHESICRFTQQYTLARVQAGLSPIRQGKSSYRVDKKVVSAVMLDLDLLAAAYEHEQETRAKALAERAKRPDPRLALLDWVNRNRVRDGLEPYADLAAFYAENPPPIKPKAAVEP
jgi:hypothetical protein